MRVSHYANKIYCIEIEDGKSKWLIDLESAKDLYEQLGIILPAVERARGVPQQGDPADQIAVAADLYVIFLEVSKWI